MSLLIPRVPLEHFHTCRVQRCLGKVIGLTVAMYLAGRLGLHGAEFLEFLICELPWLQMETSPSALRSLQVLTLGFFPSVVKVGWCCEDWGCPPVLGHLKPLPEADAQRLSGTGDRDVVGGVL